MPLGPKQFATSAYGCYGAYPRMTRLIARVPYTEEQGGSIMATIPSKTWLERAQAIAPVVQQYREECDRTRRLPPPVFDAVREAGFLRMLLPRALGGEQAPLEDALLVSEEFGRQDGSVGWNVTLAFAGSALISDYLSEAEAREIFGSHDAVVAGSFAPKGRASRVEGSYRLSGQWSFVSGCQNANWMLGGGIIFEGDKPTLGPDGTPASQLFLFPVSEGRILDTWHTGGMRGTGSHDYAVSEVLVPEARSFPFQAFFEGPPSRPNLGSRRAFMELGALFLAAVGLGIARDAIESLTALAATKTALGATTRLASQPTVQERVGRAEALLRAARSYLYETARELTSAPEGSPPMVLPARLAAAHAAQSAADVVNLMYEAGGGTAIYETSRLERCFRDVNTLTHHFLIASGVYVAAGEWRLNQGVPGVPFASAALR